MIIVIVIGLIVAALAIAFVVTKLQGLAAGKKKLTPQGTEATEPIIAAAENDNRPADCCGAHEVCESDSLLSSSDSIEYYNDEELDRFRGYKPEQYNEAEVEEFREVLYTLMEREVANWLKSLQLRQINPPMVIRDEALMIVADRRFNA
ncbi:hypothetical protein LX69_02299 [Breznakibacter xylanolyticus]|uniref:Phospholipase n=1 Tax=Breznakibacter xylanolyticus TaxID=990 RepID=A0A2W7PZK7_9BACT|nr:phospholipase [Breznakibacter xylanolyticus]PZX14969.1 hypothetical protein LX69_02299 [Breznakibacter xylanolyticus]